MAKTDPHLLNMISASLIVMTRFIERLQEAHRERQSAVPSQRPTPSADDPAPRVQQVIPDPVGERNRRLIPQDVKIAVSARDGGRCRRCGSTRRLHFDHVIPVSRGGTNSVANIQLLCGDCNRAKGAREAWPS